VRDATRHSSHRSGGPIGASREARGVTPAAGALACFALLPLALIAAYCTYRGQVMSTDDAYVSRKVGSRDVSGIARDDVSNNQEVAAGKLCSHDDLPFRLALTAPSQWIVRNDLNGSKELWAWEAQISRPYDMSITIANPPSAGLGVQTSASQQPSTRRAPIFRLRSRSWPA